MKIVFKNTFALDVTYDAACSGLTVGGREVTTLSDLSVSWQARRQREVRGYRESKGRGEKNGWNFWTKS